MELWNKSQVYDALSTLPDSEFSLCANPFDRHLLILFKSLSEGQQKLYKPMNAIKSVVFCTKGQKCPYYLFAGNILNKFIYKKCSLNEKCCPHIHLCHKTKNTMQRIKIPEFQFLLSFDDIYMNILNFWSFSLPITSLFSFPL